MASSEIVVTVGADTTQLEKGLQDVASQGGSATSKSTSFASMLGRAYGYASILLSAIEPIYGWFEKISKKAQEYRNVAVATGMNVSDIQRFDSVAKNAGVGLQSLSHTMAEFNKKMGEAKIRGSEANAALTKLGFGMKDIGNGSIKYQDALYALADAYQAGTDEATLMYYGVQMFGSSFEQLLPIVKQGSGEIRKQLEGVVTSEEKYARAAARANDALERAKSSWENFQTDLVGMFAGTFEDIIDEINNSVAGWWYSIKNIFQSDKDTIEDTATEVYKQLSPGHTKEEKEKYYDYWMKNYGITSEEEKKIFKDKIKELEGGANGKKLSPFGLSEAQGASSLQQMGGGDIVSAIAFTPLERIANATEETAANTKPENRGILEEIVRLPLTLLGL
jgi:hypothetical protein